MSQNAWHTFYIYETAMQLPSLKLTMRTSHLLCTLDSSWLCHHWLCLLVRHNYQVSICFAVISNYDYLVCRNCHTYLSGLHTKGFQIPSRHLEMVQRGHHFPSYIDLHMYGSQIQTLMHSWWNLGTTSHLIIHEKKGTHEKIIFFKHCMNHHSCGVSLSALQCWSHSSLCSTHGVHTVLTRVTAH